MRGGGRGQALSGSGFCYAISCGGFPSGTPASVVYRCDACPAIFPDDPGCGNSFNTLGEACDDGGGTCTVVLPHCYSGPLPIGSERYFGCVGAAPAQPTGPPPGEKSSGGGLDASTVDADATVDVSATDLFADASSVDADAPVDASAPGSPPDASVIDASPAVDMGVHSGGP